MKKILSSTNNRIIIYLVIILTSLIIIGTGHFITGIIIFCLQIPYLIILKKNKGKGEIYIDNKIKE